MALFAEEGANSFAEDPPDADFTCEVEGEVVNYVVELTSPLICITDECPVDELAYSAAAVGDTVLPETPIACEGEANLFIDARPQTHRVHGKASSHFVH